MHRAKVQVAPDKAGPAWAVLFGVLLLTAGCSLQRLQDFFLYHPDQPDRGPPEEYGLHARDLHPEASDGVRLHAWFFATDGARGNLLFAHGNSSNVTDWRRVVRPFEEIGLNVMLFDYRGYGTSDGEPSESGLYEDAEAARNALLAQPEAAGLPVYYYGQSLGGAVMTELATRHEPDALIVQSAWTSLGDVARRLYHVPASWALARYDSVAKIGKLHCPVLIIHGERDRVTPPSMGRRLWAAVPEEQRHALVLPDAAHEDVWFKDTKAIVAAVGRLVDWVTDRSGNLRFTRRSEP